jgi:Transposase DDE domain
MVACQSVCERQLAQGNWSTYMRFWRFVANDRVTVDKLTAGWSDQTRGAVADRHVLAIHDTSEIKFATTEENRRGLGKIKKGNAYGALLHAMIAVDADSGALLGLAGGDVWTRDGEVKKPHAQRTLTEKESGRWVATAAEATETLAGARAITVVNDREGDFYANWALTPDEKVHLLTRMMHDHALVKGGTVRSAMARQRFAAKAAVELRERADRRPRTAHLSLRFASLTLKRPVNTIEKDLPASVRVSVVEVIELHPPKGVEPVHWILLTTHPVESVAAAWQIVTWYRQRWIIEQFFRTLKLQGLRIEDSQLETADRLLKMVAIAAKAAVIIMQLVQARDGRDTQPASLAFTPDEIAVIAVLNARLQGNTQRQKNPHPPNTLAWAAWVIGKLGGWNEYSAKPPGPITFYNGLTYFRAFAAGWAFKHA